MENLLKNIEVLRRSMVKIGLDKGVNDPDVIALSQKLDKLLNDYNWLCHRQQSMA